MDGTSHLIFAEVVLKKCGLDQACVPWALAPDMDLHVGKHRYTYHRISVLKEIEKAYATTAAIPRDDKMAIAVAVLSHIYLDMFAGPVWCWGWLLPAMKTPPQVLGEYKNLNLYLISNLKPEAIVELYEGERRLFDEQLPATMPPEGFITYALDALVWATVFGRLFKKGGLNALSAYVGSTVQESFLDATLTGAYYVFLDGFFRKW
jgi:hypothetical protein